MCCSVSDTAKKHDLEAYLPRSSPPTRTGLNLALPLVQATQPRKSTSLLSGTESRRESFEAQLFSLDLETRRRAEEAHALRHSKDPRLLEFFLACSRRGQIVGAMTSVRKYREAVVQGIKRTVSVRTGSQNTCACNISLNIPRAQVELVHKSDILVKFDVVKEGEHPNQYSIIAQADDPAIRLGILVQGEDKYGQGYCFWLHCAGIAALHKANTNVDEIEGVLAKILKIDLAAL